MRGQYSKSKYVVPNKAVQCKYNECPTKKFIKFLLSKNNNRVKN